MIRTSDNKLSSEEKLELDFSTIESKISLAYDSLRELLEALSIKNGFKIYNHEGYTYFLKEILKKSSISDEFDELRKIRNSINYYGKEIILDDAKTILSRIKKLRQEISDLITKKKRVFIIHRWDGTSRSDWYPWLKKELEKKEFGVIIPKMPDTSKPKIDSWTAHLKKIIGKLDEKTYFIGHSIGCQAIMRYLEKENFYGKIGKVIFVAGWFKLNNLENEEVKHLAEPWINVPIDFEKIKQKANKIKVFLSSNELHGFIEENKKIFEEKLNAKVAIEKNKGHFTENDKISELPEILAEL